MIKHVSVIYWASKWRCLCQQQSGAETWREAHISINGTYQKQSVIYEFMEECPHVLIKLQGSCNLLSDYKVHAPKPAVVC